MRALPRIALLAPVDLSKKQALQTKIALDARLLTRHGEVTLFGNNIPGVLHEVCNCRELGNGVGSSRWRLARNGFSTYRTIAQAVVTGRFDVLFIPTVFNPLFPLLFLLGKASRSKIIYSMHDPLYETIKVMKVEVDRRAGSAWLASLILALAPLAEKMIMRLSDYVVTVSPSLRSSLINTFGKSEERVFLAYNFIPTRIEDLSSFDDDFATIRDRKSTVVMYFGYAQPKIRGLETVFKAFSILPSETFHLVIMGEVQNREYFQRLISQLGISDRVSLLSPKPKNVALAYLKRADFGILGPHPHYALPGKVFDYLYTGTRVIIHESMTDALAVLGTRAIVYRDYEDLATTIRHQTIEQAAPVFVDVSNDMGIEPLEHRLGDILAKIFGSLQNGGKSRVE